MNTPKTTGPEPRLTSLAHGGGCGCKIAPGVLSRILAQTPALPVPPVLKGRPVPKDLLAP